MTMDSKTCAGRALRILRSHDALLVCAPMIFNATLLGVLRLKLQTTWAASLLSSPRNLTHVTGWCLRWHHETWLLMPGCPPSGRDRGERTRDQILRRSCTKWKLLRLLFLQLEYKLHLATMTALWLVRPVQGTSTPAFPLLDKIHRKGKQGPWLALDFWIVCIAMCSNQL